MSLRDEVKYGTTYNKTAENQSSDSILYVLKRDAYELFSYTFDKPEFSKIGKLSWEEWEDVPFIEGGSLWREVDLKRYELKDHLGNVRVIVSDLRHAKLDNGVPTDFTAIIKHYSNYYPFGMEKPAMVWDKGSYRYGYQGQEVDNEMLGTSNAISYKYRIEDARLGRFFSIDPLSAKYPWNSPYAFSENRVIDGVELEGLEVVLIAPQFSAGVGITSSLERGLAVGPDGVYDYTSSAIGICIDAYVAFGLNFTIFPNMPSVYDAAGEGYNCGASIDLGSLLPSFATTITSATSGQYKGVNIFIGANVSINPFTPVATWSNTENLKPLSPESRKRALPILQKAADETAKAIQLNKNTISQLQNENSQISSENSKFKELLPFLDGDIKTEYSSKINDNASKYWENYDKINSLKNENNLLKQTFDVISNGIKDLKIRMSNFGEKYE